MTDKLIKIFLIGFMGSGKTSYAKPLSELLEIDFIDLDDYIEKKNNSRITQIFKEKGEDVFREYEQIALREIIENNNEFVLATGGGTPCFNKNIELINSHGISIYLKCNADELYKNILLSNPNRPMLQGKNDGDLLEYINQLLLIREPYYEQAKIVLTSENHNPKKIFDIIKNY